ncbi:MAG: desulfoferrodoxin [Spirochaetales bacterium]|nr:desulfoferrodoxin [Spirochaetales bacterium]
MRKRYQIYKCNVCGNIVEVEVGSDGDLVCCGEDMQLMEEKTADKTTEKHVPMIEKTADGYTVTVGSTLHPMEEKHYIQWIELHAGDAVYRQFLNPGDQPVAHFCVKADNVWAREYCNVHGLWKG